ncbi:MAG: hypothetical protein F6J94_05910 [Moorea sp. SIO1F2]|uniref:hypothetical protein n=1 Tax=unclassified Moorena TaxID=2683338 RepID=UPI0013B89C74|nr:MULTISPECIES: hypothetical protein [unclassified Moorena]NEO20324.1 hypothetical protein [Moorena sp. SIO4A5]NEP25089.1 hypothetical protein [Moorena sp. SIO3I6]NEQ60342.1 hypothetical protein [Moorena sp. SIO4A1]NET81503.1 hypothetical protein [Moorena sp. SIO1F2]
MTPCLCSRFPIPDSRFPFPSWEGLGVGSDSRFPIPYSLLPAPCSLFPTTTTKPYNCLGERQMQYVIHRLKSGFSKLPELFHDQ